MTISCVQMLTCCCCCCCCCCLQAGPDVEVGDAPTLPAGIAELIAQQVSTKRVLVVRGGGGWSLCACALTGEYGGRVTTVWRR
jgi:hypothetical protein